MSSCSSLKTNQYSRASLCLTGEGHLALKSENQQSSFRFESLAKSDKWLIGLQMPIGGEKVIEVSRQVNKKNIFELASVLNLSGRLSLRHSKEVLELFSSFFRAAQKREIPLGGLTGDTFTLKPSFRDQQSSPIREYRIAVVHNGFFYSSEIASIRFFYSSCIESSM